MQARRAGVFPGKGTGERWDQKNPGRSTLGSEPFSRGDVRLGVRAGLQGAAAPPTLILSRPWGSRGQSDHTDGEPQLGSGSPPVPPGAEASRHCPGPCPQAPSPVLSCTSARGELPGPWLPPIPPIPAEPRAALAAAAPQGRAGPRWCPRRWTGDARGLPLPIITCDLQPALPTGKSTKLEICIRAEVG